MDTRVWGPSLWMSLHCIALGYPESPSAIDAYNYKMFFQQLHTVLPCQVCAVHYQEHLKMYPVEETALQGPESLFAWTVRLHNAVNRSLGKPEMSLEAARELYRRVVASASGCEAAKSVACNTGVGAGSGAAWWLVAVSMGVMLGVAAAAAMRHIGKK